jgi:hypothetical protein
MLAGENLLRVWDEVDTEARRLQSGGKLPSEEFWEGRIWEPVNKYVPQIFAKS